VFIRRAIKGDPARVITVWASVQNKEQVHFIDVGY
jgi:hypothetical protein